MKKRLALVIAIILILTFVLAGCNMFEIDKERDGDQVVATVKHNGLVAEITKTEFTSYFLQNYQSYANYFEWTVEEAGENFISILARQKMNIILAVQKICEEEGKELNTTKFNASVKQNVKKGDSKKGFDVYAAYLLSLLRPDEQKYVREQTNKIFQDEYDEYIETQLENDRIKAEEESNKNNNNKDENVKEPRPTQDKKEDTTYKKDDTIIQKDADDVIDFFTANKPNDNSTQHEKDAYKEQEGDLKDTFTTYDYYLARQAELRITTKYQDYFEGVNENIEVKVSDNYKETLQSQMKSYKTASSYKSAIEGDTTVIYHNGRYVKVKSILLQFSEEQQSVLSYIQKKYEGESLKEFVKEVRKALVFGTDIVDVNLDKYMEDLCGLKVYKSNPKYDPKKPAGDPAKKDANKTDEQMNYPYEVNPNYDPDKPEGKDNEKWKSVDFLDVIAELGAALKKLEGTGEGSALEAYKKKYNITDDSQIDQVGLLMFTNQKKVELFDEWIYLVNDDSGMFEGKEYTETPVGNSSDYVVEYTALVRQLLLDNETAGSVKIDDTNGNTLHTSLNNISVITVKVAGEEVEIYTDTENNISFIVNDFGVHIVMLTTVPVDKGYNTTEGVHYTVTENTDFDMTEFEDNTKYTAEDIELIKKENSYFTLTLDAYVGFDEETGKAITLKEKLTKDLQSTFDSTAYSKFSEKVFDMYGEKLFDKKDDKDPAEGFADYKFELSLKKSIYNKVVSFVKSRT